MQHKFLKTLESNKYNPQLCIGNLYTVSTCSQVLHLSVLSFHTTVSHYMPNSQNTAAERNQPKRTALRASVRFLILSIFPLTSRGLSQITCKVQLNVDPQEEIFHHYTYAMSVLRAPTDFMWAAGIYFRDWRVIIQFQLSNKLSGFCTSSCICYSECVSFNFLLLRVFPSIQTSESALAEYH